MDIVARAKVACWINQTLVRKVGLEPTRRKAQVPKTCVSAISPLPRV